MAPVMIQAKTIDIIIEWLNDIGVDLLTEKAIPLVYDFGCRTGVIEDCRGRWNSFNGEK